MISLFHGALTLAVARVILAGKDDACQVMSCVNGGVCVDGQGCQCPPEYAGDFCQLLVSPCSQNPCLAGQCQVNGTGFTCICDQFTVPPYCMRLQVPKLEEPRRVVYSKTDQYNISCDASGDPYLSVFVMKDGYKKHSGSLHKFKVGPGQYQCGAENKYGTALSDNIVTRHVAFKQASVSHYILNPGEHVQMACAQPTETIAVTYTWFRVNYLQLNISTQVNAFAGFHVDFRGSLHIFQASTNDTGTYKCNVSFRAGGRLYTTEQQYTLQLNPTQEHGSQSNSTKDKLPPGNSTQEVGPPNNNGPHPSVPGHDVTTAPVPPTFITTVQSVSDTTTRHPPTPTTYMTPPKPAGLTTTGGQSIDIRETTPPALAHDNDTHESPTITPSMRATTADNMPTATSSDNATTLPEGVVDNSTTSTPESTAVSADNMTTVQTADNALASTTSAQGLSRRRRQSGVMVQSDMTDVSLTASRETYLYGETAVLECLCNHRLNQTTWNIPYHQGTQFSLWNRRLTIYNVTHRHAGNYLCSCAGQRSHPVNISVNAALLWNKIPEPQITLEGETAELSCDAINSDGRPHSHPQWFINTKPLQDYASNHNITYELTGSSVRFPNISRFVHNFNVQCNASNNHSYLYHNSYLMVLVPMELSAEEEYITIGPSDNKVLKIKLKKDPIATKEETVIKWKHRRTGQSEYRELPSELNKERILLDVEARNASWKEFLGEYMCVVRVQRETRSVTFTVREEQDVADHSRMDVTISGLAGALLALVVIVAVCWKRRLVRRALRRGASNPDKMVLDLTNMNQSSRYVSFPRNTDEFPVDRLHFLDTLGSGNFGKVMKAEALDIHGSGKWDIVAVKMCKDTATDATKENLYHETAIMRKIPKHINVVGYLGYVTSSDPSLLIMEFVVGGDLLTYLRRRRPEKTNVRVIDEEKGEAKDEDQGKEKEANETEAVVKEDTQSSVENKVGNLLSSRDLSSFALQIAKGMEHLATINVIHRDLAARNVLLGVGNVCKISDFGLARDMEGSDEYEVSSMGPLPIRWMSPESLTDGLYTLKSDVWSYGVLLWEIVTLGASPYSGQSARQVMLAVRDGKRLEKPDHCADSVYTLMTRCWRQHPGDRPTFSDLSTTIERHLEEEAEYIQLSNFDVNIYGVIDMGAIDVIEERV